MTELQRPDIPYLPHFIVPPGYFETHSQATLTWKSTPQTRQFSEASIARCVHRFTSGDWGRNSDANLQGSNQQVIDRWTGLLIGCYGIDDTPIYIIQEIGHSVPIVMTPGDFEKIFLKPV